MRHLVLGAGGQVGSELVAALAGSGTVIGLARPDLDLRAHHDLAARVREAGPTVVWNAAAATGVDALEDDPALAFAVNAEAPAVLAAECRRLGATLVHFSTDYVFDGRKPGPYVEEDPPAPLNVYGRSKLAGEEAVRAAGGRWVVLRTSWVYGVRGRNFVRAIAARRADPVLRVVSDQAGAPTWSRDIATACARIVPQLGRGPDRSGIYHLSAAGRATWFEVAGAVRDALVTRGVDWRAVLQPVSTSEYGARAARPANSVLSNRRLEQVFGLRMPDWRPSLEQAVAIMAEDL